MADSKKPSFSKPRILNTFSQNFQWLVLGREGSIDMSAIDFTQPMWLSGCPRQGEFTTENNKNAFWTVNSPYVGQPEDHIGWPKSMPFT